MTDIPKALKTLRRRLTHVEGQHPGDFQKAEQAALRWALPILEAGFAKENEILAAQREEVFARS